MKRVMLIVAYDGTNYCGWQMQPNGISVESVINEKLSELVNEQIKIIGASRTDAGVHALGNVAVFDTESRIPADKFSFALNQRLPDDIVIRGSNEVDADFHPRHCKSSKTYEYKILNTTFNIPTLRYTTYFYYMPLDIKAMQKAAQYLIGVHNFKSFCSPNTSVLDMVREIYNIEIFKEDEVVTIRVIGGGFLYNMVRIIAGTLIKVGSGAYTPECVKDIIEAEDRTAAGPTAPARGLALVGMTF